jgi:hypothetical protein
MKSPRAIADFDRLVLKHLNGGLNKEQQKRLTRFLETNSACAPRLVQLARTHGGSQDTCDAQAFSFRAPEAPDSNDETRELPDIQFGIGIHRCVRGWTPARGKRSISRRHMMQNRKLRYRGCTRQPWFPILLAGCLLLVSVICFNNSWTERWIGLPATLTSKAPLQRVKVVATHVNASAMDPADAQELEKLYSGVFGDISQADGHEDLFAPKTGPRFVDTHKKCFEHRGGDRFSHLYVEAHDARPLQ